MKVAQQKSKIAIERVSSNLIVPSKISIPKTHPKKQQLEARPHSLHSFITSQNSLRTKTGLPTETRCDSTSLLETPSCRTNNLVIWIENTQVTSWLLNSLDFLLHVDVSAHNTPRLEFLEIPKIAICSLGPNTSTSITR
jgi:hypothetical protein